jgi:hypothetical protein
MVAYYAGTIADILSTVIVVGFFVAVYAAFRMYEWARNELPGMARDLIREAVTSVEGLGFCYAKGTCSVVTSQSDCKGSFFRDPTCGGHTIPVPKPK